MSNQPRKKGFVQIFREQTLDTDEWRQTPKITRYLLVIGAVLLVIFILFVEISHYQDKQANPELYQYLKLDFEAKQAELNNIYSKATAHLPSPTRFDIYIKHQIRLVSVTGKYHIKDKQTADQIFAQITQNIDTLGIVPFDTSSPDEAASHRKYCLGENSLTVSNSQYVANASRFDYYVVSISTSFEQLSDCRRWFLKQQSNR